MSRLDLHGHPLRREAHGASDRSRPSRERWLLSYADFVTLLLALFVVLYAGAAVQETQEARLLEGLRSAFVSGSLTTREDAPGAG